MNSNLIKLINAERQRYIDFFVAKTEELSQNIEVFATELAIHVNDENSHFPFDTIRIDFISKTDDNEHSILELRLDSNMDYEEHIFTIGDFKLHIYPFCWNYCEFEVDNVNMESLKKWFIKWLNIDNEPESYKLANSVHSCTIPELNEDRVSFAIDFGTATDDAFIEFIQMLASSGSTDAIIRTISV
jgi:hypothetical protein